MPGSCYKLKLKRMQTDNGKIEKNTAGIATKEAVIGVEKICYFSVLCGLLSYEILTRHIT